MEDTVGMEALGGTAVWVGMVGTVDTEAQADTAV